MKRFVEIEFTYDYDRILNSKLGNFAIAHFAFKEENRKFIKPKDNFDKLVHFGYYWAGELALWWLHAATWIFYKLMTPEELEEYTRELQKGPPEE